MFKQEGVNVHLSRFVRSVTVVQRRKNESAPAPANPPQVVRFPDALCRTSLGLDQLLSRPLQAVITGREAR
jgi:hypothetical protein